MGLSLGKVKLSAEQRVKKCTTDIIQHERYRALASVIMLGEKRVDDSVPTACTNGRDEIYGRAFVDDFLNDSNLRYVMLHESYHKLLKHLRVYKHLADLDNNICGQALDHWINLKLNEENRDGWATMPTYPNGKPMGLANPKYRGWDVPKIFWEIYDSQEGNNGGDGQEEGEGGDGQQGGQQGGFDSHDWDGAAELTDEEVSELDRDIEQAVRQGALMAGKTGSSDSAREFTNLIKPQVDWRRELRKFVTAHCKGDDNSTWSKPNRRHLARGDYRPSSYSESLSELHIDIDMSYSIGQRELTAALSELSYICKVAKPENVKIMYWDTKVVEPIEEFKQDELANIEKSTKPRGGGGTDVNCVCDYMKQHKMKPQCAVVITDGELYNGWGKWDCPVLWVIIDNKNAKPTVGRALHINSWDLRK